MMQIVAWNLLENRFQFESKRDDIKNIANFEKSPADTRDDLVSGR